MDQLNSSSNPLETNKIKTAILGGGINSAVGNVHQIAIKMDNRFELVSGCFSQIQDINEATAIQYGIGKDRTYSTLDELLSNEKNQIDVIVILTPTPQHKDDVIKCLESGIPVICEKALATSSNEAMEIQETLDKTGGFLAITYNYTGYPMLRELRHMIQQGKFGKVEQIHIEMPQEGFARLDKQGNPQKPQEWRLQDGTLPTLSLDLGVHVHHLIDYLTNETPIEVVATQSSFGTFKQVIDNTLCIANYTNNIVSNIWFSKAALGHRNGLRIRIYGDSGSAEWYQLNPEDLIFHDNQGQTYTLDRANIDMEISNQTRYNRFKAGHPSGFIEAFANHYFDIADCLTDFISTGKRLKNDHVFSINHAHQGLVMLEAMVESSINKSWVRVN